MKDLFKVLDNNNIKYLFSDYAGYESIVIKGNKYKIEIYKNEKGFVSDLQKIPYTWGRMGSTTFDVILEDLRDYLNINITNLQLSLF